MKKACHKSLQRQIDDLIALIELCLPFIQEVDRAKEKLSSLAKELEQLKKQAEYLKLKTPQINSPASDSNFPSQIEEAEFDLDFSIDDLEATLLHLGTFQHKINDLVVLKERVEALQEERQNNITPERIYRLLEKQQQALLTSEGEDRRSPQPSENNSKINYFQSLWQKIVARKHTQLAKGTAIATGIILCFSVVSYSSMKYQLVERNAVEQSKELDPSLADI